MGRESATAAQWCGRSDAAARRRWRRSCRDEQDYRLPCQQTSYEAVAREARRACEESIFFPPTRVTLRQRPAAQEETCCYIVVASSPRRSLLLCDIGPYVYRGARGGYRWLPGSRVAASPPTPPLPP